MRILLSKFRDTCQMNCSVIRQINELIVLPRSLPPPMRKLGKERVLVSGMNIAAAEGTPSFSAML